MEIKFINGVAHIIEVPTKQVSPDLSQIVLHNGDQCIIRMGDNQSLTLWKEHNAYHVRFCDFLRPSTDPNEVNKLSAFYRIWEVSDTLSAAKKHFRRLSKHFRPLIKEEVTK